jgi:hypothetical protein
MSKVPDNGSHDDQSSAEPRRVPRSTVFMASAMLCVPAMIPFYYARGMDNTTGRILLIGLGTSVLVMNALIVILGVRWIERYGGEG